MGRGVGGLREPIYTVGRYSKALGGRSSRRVVMRPSVSFWFV